MALRHAPVSNATALADLLDATLAEDWSDDTPTLAVLSWRGPHDDDLELATKRIERPPVTELRFFGPDHECLAVCLSRLEPPGRVTVAFDEFDEVTVIRHRDGRIERPAVTGGPTADLLRPALSELSFRT
jgi:hypothetical protein